MSISYAVFCLKNPATPDIYPLSLHDALPICEPKLSLVRIFQRDLITTTIQTTLVIGSFMCIYYSLNFWYPTVLRDAGRTNLLPFLAAFNVRSEEHTSELQSHVNLVCRLLLEKSRDPRHLPSFPTRRSSDLRTEAFAGADFSARPDYHDDSNDAGDRVVHVYLLLVELLVSDGAARRRPDEPAAIPRGVQRQIGRAHV